MKRMLINATQAEERRLAIVDGQKLLDYEIEIEGREQRKGNIYKAVVTRIEPSLEACFVDYGEERHGFLPFKEISRQYFAEGISVSQAKINEAIREGQELVVQVEKEERGNKGAALTTFISLAGRYVVLMPNNPRGGGVSRRIEGDERAELKEALDQLQYPKGMSIIARTAGIGRSAEELQWDLNYLLKLWDAVDGAAKGGKGAFLIYQESNLVIRAIRDYFNTDIGDILIDTDDIYEQASQFMSYVMPEHASRVKRYRDPAALFSRFQIEHQIESAYARTVQLPSGGAIVIDQTEALVAVDVNSARAIKGGDIEDTATRTNLEAADEVARQMRLRDLGGLVVIDFIDMEDTKNRRAVENRLRDALRQDRARVQLGSISKFGLLEMSRQRLKPTLAEGASIPCPRCGGSGHVRDTESSALQILRVIQEESMKDGTAAVHCQVPVEVGSFLLNEKRAEVAKVELQQRVNVLIIPNKSLETPNYKLDRLKGDDPRLEESESSYKLAKEVQDPVAATRRSQEPTNRQTPVLKGVLHDAPAPVAAPRPEKPKAAAAPVSQPAGFFTRLVASIKNFFSAAEPEQQDKPTKGNRDAQGNNSRRGNNAERGRGKNGERSKTDNRSATNGNRDNRDNRETREGRETRESREGREGRDGRNNATRDSREVREGRDNREGRTPREGRKNADVSATEDNRESRNRTPRSRRDNEPSREQDRRVAQADEPQSSNRDSDGQEPRQRNDRSERAERTERTERSDRGERSPRNSRPPRERDPRNSDDEATLVQNTESLADQAVSEAPLSGDANRNENGERRERRSRSQHGRNRRRNSDGEERPRQDYADNAAEFTAEGAENAPAEAPAAPVRAEAAAVTVAAPVTQAIAEPVESPVAPQGAPEAPTEAPVRRSYFERAQAAAAASATEQAHATSAPAVDSPAPAPVQESAVAAAPVAPATPVAAVETAQAPAPVPAAAPVAAPAPAKAAATKLDIAALNGIVATAGLEWVHSDASKVAAAQAAIAATPKPVHVPRERPPAVTIDNTPLILVETRKDLSSVKLPFDQ